MKLNTKQIKEDISDYMPLIKVIIVGIIYVLVITNFIDPNRWIIILGSYLFVSWVIFSIGLSIPFLKVPTQAYSTLKTLKNRYLN